MRLFCLLLLAGCATLPASRPEFDQPAHENAYLEGRWPGSGGAISMSGPGATSSNPTFTKVTSSTIQIPAGGSESGNGCVGYSTSDQICFNPNQMDITASAGINLNNQVNITGTSPILYANAATGKTQLTTNISAANTNNTTAPAVEIIPQNALDATDYILAVRKSDATDLFTVSQNGNTATPNGKTSAAGVDVSSSGLNFLAAGGYVSFNGTTQGGILTTSISAASAGATPGSAAHRIYSDNALDATDYVLSVGNAANATSLFNVAYNGATTSSGSFNMNGSQLLARSGNFTQFSVGSAGTAFFNVDSNSNLSASTPTSEATTFAIGGILNINVTPVASSGNASNLISYTLPANTLNTAGHCLEITGWGHVTNNANAKTVSLAVGSQTVVTKALTPSIAIEIWKVQATVCRTGTSTQQIFAEAWNEAGTTVSSVDGATTLYQATQTSGTQTETSTIVIKGVATTATTTDITMDGLVVKFL